MPEKIDKASEHLLSLINDVLDMSKIGNDGVKLEEIPIDLDEEIERSMPLRMYRRKKKALYLKLTKKRWHIPDFLEAPDICAGFF